MKIYNQEYEYGGMLANTWDLLRGDTSDWPDRYFFKEFIDQHGGQVLDVGCGTGRLLLDYLADGVAIEGVDNSPEMLELCRKKGEEVGLVPRLYQQSMVDLDLPKRYRIIIVPSSSFQLVSNEQDARKAMNNFFKHLEPGGFLVMPFMLLWWEGEPLDTGWMLDGEKEWPEEEVVIHRWSRSKFDPGKQLEHTETRFERVKGGEIMGAEYHARSPATCWYTQHQVREMYLSSGFTNLQFYSEFSWEPAQEDVKTFSVVGEKPTA